MLHMPLCLHFHFDPCLHLILGCEVKDVTLCLLRQELMPAVDDGLGPGSFEDGAELARSWKCSSVALGLGV